MFQKGAEQTAAPSGGDRGPTSEKQRKDYGSEAKTAEYRLEAGQPNSIFRRLSHAPLFAQVGILATLGFIAAGLGQGRRPGLVGCGLLIAGLLILAGLAFGLALASQGRSKQSGNLRGGASPVTMRRSGRHRR
jgi:hypothetical protein